MFPCFAVNDAVNCLRCCVVFLGKVGLRQDAISVILTNG